MPRGVFVRTEEHKRKLREARKIQIGERHPMYGKSHSKETKRKISEAMKGKHAGEKHPMYGITGDKSPGHKEKPTSMNQYHQRMRRIIPPIKCFLCGMTNEESKIQYKQQGLCLHCRDGNWANSDPDNWIYACRKDHWKLDRIDGRPYGGAKGIKGHIGERSN